METKKFKVSANNGVNGNKPKGGKNNTQTILTAGGIMGAAAVGYASGALHNDEQQEEQQIEQIENASTQQETTQHTEQQTEQEQQEEGHQSEELQPIVDDYVDSNSSQQPVEDVNPDEIAQQIAQANEIDNNDNESADMLNVEGLTTAMGPDGQEYVVAIVHTPDGGEYMLADTDGDGVFSDVFDMEGNYVGLAEGDLTASDLEEMADPSGGYLAMADDEPMGDDPTEDIVNTTGEVSEEHDLADNEGSDGDDEMTDDELLAQLLDDNDSDDEVADHVYEEGGDEDDADIAVNESDNDSEDIAETDSDDDDTESDLAENTDDVDDSVDDDDLTA